MFLGDFERLVSIGVRWIRFQYSRIAGFSVDTTHFLSFCFPLSQDYKRRDTLRGGSGKASFSTPVTTDPSRADVIGGDAPRDAYATQSSSSRRMAASERGAAADVSQGREGWATEGSGLVGKAGGGGARRRRRRRLPGRVPLGERSQEHRKFYKVGGALAKGWYSRW